jgi:ribosomal protein L7/L12
MKRFVALLIFGGLAYWAYWYTFSVDPGGDGFGFEPCNDGEGGVCSNDPSVFTLILAIGAGVVAFFLLVSCFNLIRRKVKGEDTSKPKNRGFSWVNTPTASVSHWTNQVSSSIQNAAHTATQAQAMAQQQWTQAGMPGQMGSPGQPLLPGPAANPAVPGQAGVIGAAGVMGANPSHATNTPAPQARQAGGAMTPTTQVGRAGVDRAPTQAERQASRDAWLARSRTAPAEPVDDPLSGVPATPPVVQPSPPSMAAQAATAAAAHPATGDLVLVIVGPREMGVQREVRRLTGMDLAGAKAFLAEVAKGPQVVQADMPWDEAQDVVRTLQKMGATAEVR